MKKELLNFICKFVCLFCVGFYVLGIFIQLLQPKGEIGAVVHSDKKTGVCIRKLERGMPAEQAGLQVNDCIVSVNGKKNKNATNIPHVLLILRGKSNSKVTLEIKRDNEILKYNLTRQKNQRGIDLFSFF